MSQKVPMTRQGYDALKLELKRLKSEERPKIVKEIEEALAHGDLSENAEYHAAKEKQGHVAGRIASIEDKLARAQVIEAPGEAPERVRFGTTVKLIDSDTEEELSYRIVGEDEADPKRGMISVTSPVAQSLINRRVDDQVTVRTPKGVREFEILEIGCD